MHASSSGNVQVIALPKPPASRCESPDSLSAGESHGHRQSQRVLLAVAAVLSVVIHAAAFLLLGPSSRPLPEPSKQPVLEVRLVPEIVASRTVVEEASATALPNVRGASLDTTTSRTPIRAPQRPPRSVPIAQASQYERSALLPAPAPALADENATPLLAAEPPTRVLATTPAVTQTAAGVVGEIGQGSDAGQAGEVEQAGEAGQRSSATTAAPMAYRNNPKPDYPLAARRDEQQGLVVLRVLVSKNGHPAEIKIGKSSGFSLLDAAAVAGVKRWSFIAAQSNQQSIDAWMDIPIRFRLDENEN